MHYSRIVLDPVLLFTCISFVLAVLDPRDSTRAFFSCSAWASPVAAHGLCSLQTVAGRTGSRARRLSCPTAYRILVPRPGNESVAPAL